MESHLSVVVRDRQDPIVLRVSGELDVASSPQLGTALDRLEPASGGRLILDLAELTFIDVTGLRMLLRAQEQAERGGAELVLLNVPTAVRRLVDLTGSTQLLEAIDGRLSNG